MSGIGEKIKGALTGHHHQQHHDAADKSKSSGADSFSSSPQTAQEKHDPEIDAKKATSAAGNYPYWGDLPREGEAQQGVTTSAGDAVDTTTAAQEKAHHNYQRDSGVAVGGLGAGAAGAGYLASSRDQEPQDHTAGATQQSLPDRTRQTAPAPGQDNDKDDFSRRDLAAGAGVGAGVGAGAAYLASRYGDKKDDEKAAEEPTTTSGGGASAGPAQAGPGTPDQGYYGNQGGRSFPLQDNKTAGAADAKNHRREEELLAGGAGAAGLAGAGYYASKKHNEDKTRPEDLSSHTATTATTTTTTTTNPAASTQRNPNPSGAPTAAGTTTSGLGDEKDRRRRDEELLAAGAGAAGLAGAGYYASKKHSHDGDGDGDNKYAREDRPTTGGGVHNTVVGAGSPEDPYAQKVPREAGSAPPPPPPLSSSNAATVGPQTSTSGLPQQQQAVGSGYGAPRSGDDRDRQALYAAAGVGAGAGAVAAEEKYRHRKEDAKSSPDMSTTASQPAQLAAQQAWSKQSPSSAAAGGDDPSRYDGNNNNSSSSSSSSRAGAGAAAALAGAGVAGTAAYYGQGKEHDQDPRSDKSEEIADRALGRDTSTSDAYTSTGFQPEQKTSSMPGAFPSGSLSGSGLNPSRVVHKCQQCGADNDISHYFNKDASFRAGS